MTETTAATPAAPPAAPGKRALKLVGLVLLLAAIGTSLALPQTRELLKRFLEYAQGLGPWRAAPLIGAIYIPACVFFLPGSVVTLGAGFACGVVAGTVAVSLGSTAGAAVAFVLGRTLARDWVAARVAKNPKFHAIDEAIAKQGFKIVLLLRLSPVFPFNMLNYALGITKVRFRDYLLASWIGMLPGTVMYVYFGSALRNLADVFAGKVEGGPAKYALFAVGLVATVVVAVLVARVARKAIAEAVPGEKPPTDAKDLPERNEK